MENEIWKDIKGFEGLYQVSSLGRIKSLLRITKHYKGGKSILKGKLKKISLSKGYNVVGLCKLGKNHTKKVHRLVAECFIKNPLNKPQINHINGTKTDNIYSNLEWSTAKENVLHAHKTGLHNGSHKGLFGKHNPNSKSVIQFDLKGNKIKEFGGIYEAQRQTSVIAQNISFACNGKYKQAGGFIWKYKNLAK